jgi:hypothetical protein
MKASRARRWIGFCATILFLLALNIGACACVAKLMYKDFPTATQAGGGYNLLFVDVVSVVLILGFNFFLWIVSRWIQSSDFIRTTSCSPLRPYFSDYRLGSLVLKGLANARKEVQRTDANFDETNCI